MKILIADDDTMLRSSFVEAYLSNEDVIECRNGKELVEAYFNNSPEAIITNINMPVMNGKEAIRIIREHDKHIKILVITGEEDQLLYNDLLSKYDVWDIIPKGLEHAREILVSLNSTQPIMRRSVKEVLFSKEPEDKGLTPREQEVLEYKSRGYKDVQIAKELFVSLLTIRTHVRNMKAKGYRPVTTLIKDELCISK